MAVMDRKKLEETVGDENEFRSLLRTTAGDQHDSSQADSDDRLITAFADLADQSASFQRQRTATTSRSLKGDSIHEQQVPNRYELIHLLGVGATGQVYQAIDNNFQRPVAMKFLHPKDSQDSHKVARFIREARVTANLEHPNILPVHDLDFTDKGISYFTMREAHGNNLQSTIDEAVESGKTPVHIASWNDRVHILIKVCDAVAYAHHNGIIHRDIKPDNIMLGEFGEVILLDWGTASTRNERSLAEESQTKGKLLGTPAYMSPEQARKEPSDERSDIYCLGATLFQLITLRHPTWGDSAEEFWEKKRNGIIDPLPDHVYKNIPPRLLAITTKAMSPKAEDRYTTVSDFAADLKGYQEGQSISAYKDTPWAVLLRWYHSYTIAFWVAAIGLLFISIASTAYILEKQKEQSQWQLVFSDDFNNGQSLNDNWVSLLAPNWDPNLFPVDSTHASWSIKDNQLIGVNQPGCSNLRNKIPLAGNIRVEWDYTPLNKSVNLNCFISGSNRYQGYTFHINSFGKTGYNALTRGEDLALIDHVYPAPVYATGTTHSFVMERRDHTISLSIDGEQFFSFRDLEIFSGLKHQYFGFEHSGGNVHAIDNVRVYQQPLPQKVSPIQVGLRLYADSLYQQAFDCFTEISAAYPHTELAINAQWHAARCLIKLHKEDEAQKAFRTLLENNPHHDIIPETLTELASLHLTKQETDKAFAYANKLAQLAPSSSAAKTLLFALSKYYSDIWQLDTTKAFAHPKIIDGILETTANIRHWGKQLKINIQYNNVLELCAKHLNIRGEHKRVLQLFPNNKQACADALRFMGRLEESYAYIKSESAIIQRKNYDQANWEAIIKNGDHQRQGLSLIHALIATGALSLDSLTQYETSRETQSLMLMYLKEYDTIIREYPHTNAYVHSLRATGAPEEDVLQASTYVTNKASYYFNLIYTHRTERALKEISREFPEYNAAFFYEGLYQYIQGHTTRAHEWWKRGQAEICSHRTVDRKILFFNYYLMALLPMFEGNTPEALRRLRKLSQEKNEAYSLHLLYDCQYLLGDISEEEYLQQPVRPWIMLLGHTPNWLRGLRSEITQHPAQAIDYYQKEMITEIYNPWMEMFCNWRIHVLSTQADAEQVTP